ncbi:hypothetical protein FRC08_017393 [Ceratobasidium sp. 394]|nr:hypothetical protein FRC08_017393 [Ceratobasidium sp. 394]
MPPKRKSAVKATLHRVEKGLRRLFRDRERALPDTESDTWSHIDLSNTDWAGLERFSRVLEANSGAVGPLTLAIDRFSKCVKIFEEQAMVRPEYLELGTDLNDLFHALAERFEKTDLASTTLDTFANLARCVEDLSYEMPLVCISAKPSSFDCCEMVVLHGDEGELARSRGSRWSCP